MCTLHKTSGSSLIAVSVIVLIASLMISSYIGVSQNKESDARIKVTLDNLAEIDRAISVFYKQNGFIPCPAQRTATINSANFGISNDCAAAVADTVETGSGVDTVRIGVVPTRTLSISDKYMYDGWNNRIKYSVIRDLARTSVMFTGYTTATTRVVTIQDSAGTAINPQNTNQTAYVLVSHGKDGSGARNFLGDQIPASCLVNQDNENCDDDATFRFQPSNDSVGTASYYDDIIKWKTISDVKNTQILSGGSSVASNGIAAIRVGTFNTGYNFNNTLVAGCGNNCKVEGTWAPTFATVSPNLIGVSTFSDRITAPAGRYIMRMSTPYCGVGRGVGLMFYSGAPINQIGRHFASYSYENTVTGTHRCSRSTAIAYFTHDGIQPIRFGRYMDNLTPNAATYHFGISYQWNPFITNNAGYSYEYVQVELWQLD